MLNTKDCNVTFFSSLSVWLLCSLLVCLVTVVYVLQFILTMKQQRTQTFKFLNIPSLIMNFKLLSGWYNSYTMNARLLDTFKSNIGERCASIHLHAMKVIYILIYIIVCVDV